MVFSDHILHCWQHRFHCSQRFQWTLDSWSAVKSARTGRPQASSTHFIADEAGRWTKKTNILWRCIAVDEVRHERGAADYFSTRKEHEEDWTKRCDEGVWRMFSEVGETEDTGRSSLLAVPRVETENVEPTWTWLFFLKRMYISTGVDHEISGTNIVLLRTPGSVGIPGIRGIRAHLD